MMRNLLILLLMIHIQVAGHTTMIKNAKPKLTSEFTRGCYMGPKSRIVTGVVDTKLNEIAPDNEIKPCIELPIDKQSLTPGEALAAVFALLKFPPPFEQATIKIPIAMTLLLTHPNAYLGKMSPLHGKARWLQGDGQSQLELINAPNGYACIQWPARELGIPNGAKLVLQMDDPVVAAQYLWSDFTCYGYNIARFLLHQVTNWSNSSRSLIINRSGYREILFPTNLKEAVHHNQVRPILEPYLKEAAPQLLKELSEEVS